MKNYVCKSFNKSISFIVFFIYLISLKGDPLYSEYLFEELEIGTTTKTEETSSVLPNNPFEIVEMIRRQNSMNNATAPSEALDDALKSFNNMKDKQEN